MSGACVILAAGAGRRMGGVNKALLRWQGEPFLERIAGACRHLGVSELVVVVAAPHRRETERAASALSLECVVNPAPDIGMASSVAVGYAHALRHFDSDACWLWPVDAPGIAQASLRVVSDQSDVAKIVTPRFSGRGGHPSLVGRQLWTALSRCDDEPEGARTVFRRHGQGREYVDVEDAAVCHDIDIPSDMESIPC